MLFWIVHRVGNEQRYFIAEGAAPLFARLRASMAGLPADSFRELHALDAKLARKVPKAMVGLVLSQREAEALLDRLS